MTDLPHILQPGILDINGRSIGCGVLSDRRRVLFDTPIPGVCERGSAEWSRAAVSYLADDGAILEGISSRELATIASEHVQRVLVAVEKGTATAEDRAIGMACNDMLATFALTGLDALRREAEGAAQ